jgi:transcriptional regulator with XRE-family HTH domain
LQYEEDEMSIGENIKKIRLTKMLTQTALSSALFYSTPMIVRIEQGKKIPSFDELKVIAKVLDVEVTALLDDEQRCMVCGYTCEGECYWGKKDLCSVCADKEDTE